ncbi:MAG TPA: aspartate aminotransferase family protein [Nitrolancea sp.]|jgi:glutamate-1-semialdehyde 2,1-aminomutase|nr:aspartate aminotransferase family protein [Nitrolancea sp.]
MSSSASTINAVDRYAGSRRLYEDARDVLAGGNSRLTVFYKPHPVYVDHGEGAYLFDVDGNRYLDVINNYTSLIHGHAHPEVEAAAIAALRGGTAFAAPTNAEIKLAKLLCERLPAVDQLRFVNSGTEAVMMAVKAARAFTGKPGIAKFEGAYHGAYDYVEVSLASSPESWGDSDAPASTAYSAGVPQSVLDDVVVLPFNRIDETRALLRRHRDRLAAVLIDVMPSRVGLVPASPEFVAAVQEECRALGILLISDEVISFRVGYRGAQGAYGFEPDLTTLAKIIGGGFPVGAIGGRREVMAVFDAADQSPRVPHGGTFNANPVTMAAGLKAMELLTPDVFDRLNRDGEQLRQSLSDVIRLSEVEWQVTGAGSLFRLIPTRAPLSDYRSAHLDREQSARAAALHWELMNRGIFIGSGGFGCLSTPMGESEIEAVVHAVEATLRTGDL